MRDKSCAIWGGLSKMNKQIEVNKSKSPKTMLFNLHIVGRLLTWVVTCCTAGGEDPSCAAGRGWVGSLSGWAGGSPAPARLETDWMTGMAAVEAV